MTPVRLIPLGARVREQYTGIEGVVISITSHLHGQNELCLCRDGVDENGGPWSLQWFPISRCELAA